MLNDSLLTWSANRVASLESGLLAIASGVLWLPNLSRMESAQMGKPRATDFLTSFDIVLGQVEVLKAKMKGKNWDRSCSLPGNPACQRTS